MKILDKDELLKVSRIKDGILRKPWISGIMEHLNGIFEDEGAVGLDIGVYSIKAVEVEHTLAGPVVGTIGYKEIQDASKAGWEERAAGTLNDLWHQCKFKSRNVRLVISDPTIYFRHITIPKVSESELSKAIRWQAEKFTPFSIESAEVDFQFSKVSERSEDGQMGAVFVAVPNPVIEKYLKILKQARLFPLLIDVNAFAAAAAAIRFLPADTADEIVPVIDIGAAVTSIIIFRGEELLLVRNVDIAGNHFTKIIMDKAGLAESQAETMKKESVFYAKGFEAQDSQIFSLLEQSVSELSGQIERSLAYCSREFLVEKVSQVMICGGGADLKGLDIYLSEKLGVPVRAVNPLKALKCDPKKVNPEKAGQLSSKLLCVLGVAVEKK